ncbi:MAG: hypothetical protein GQ564_14340 [Bacteroidales bacterium]|nr:hypothetical protein [Bacteroidales bacterium]
MKKINFLFILILFLIALACSETEYVDNKPQLEIQVVDSENNLIEQAQVCLYDSETDWAKRTNAISELITNEQGIVLFEELDTKQYYFFVEKESLTNLFDIYTHTKPLEINVISQIKTKIK